MDVVERIRPIILELERTHSSMLVISHRAVLRVIFAYFTGR
jgi:6-phosphofructo-2-kinase